MRKWNLLFCAGAALLVCSAAFAATTSVPATPETAPRPGSEKPLEPVPNSKTGYLEYPTETDANGRDIYKAPPVYGIPAPVLIENQNQPEKEPDQ
jgi:hypothetical protein